MANVLVILAVVNALASAGSLAARPATSNWEDPMKIVCHAVWDLTGSFSIALTVFSVAYWVGVRFFAPRRDADRRLAIAAVIAGLHAAFWLLSPSWS
ncbi:MAG: hypothetical protein JXB13_13335 [Phycisphaerae bacterium]|nr:hypothetical protein [Phycisphaerae bacterium]